MGFVFRKDPCGVVCVAITHLLVYYADFVVIKFLLPTYENRYVEEYILNVSRMSFSLSALILWYGPGAGRWGERLDVGGAL
jgi:hypothetical protein